jgi:hypothetical protein
MLSLALIFFITAGVIGYLLFTGPRMFVQPNIRPFQMVTPVSLPNSVPVIGIYAPLPDNAQAEQLKNPLARTDDNYAKGKVYYGYYCAFCHGDKGDGFGPVGYSYVPGPADLRSPNVQSQSDGRLLLSILTGTGHSPMLERIVPAEYYWYLVLYVRRLALPSDASAPVPRTSDTKLDFCHFLSC